MDTDLLAGAIYWACEEPRCAGETYNIANRRLLFLAQSNGHALRETLWGGGLVYDYAFSIARSFRTS